MEASEGLAWQGRVLCNGLVIMLEMLFIITRGRAVEKDNFETGGAHVHALMVLMPLCE